MINNFSEEMNTADFLHEDLDSSKSYLWKTILLVLKKAKEISSEKDTNANTIKDANKIMIVIDNIYAVRRNVINRLGK